MSNCEQCGAQPAIVNLTTVRDGAVRQERLCAACAEARGVWLTRPDAEPLSALVPDWADLSDLSDPLHLSPEDEARLRALLGDQPDDEPPPRQLT